MRGVRILCTMPRRFAPLLLLPLSLACDGVPLRWEPATPAAAAPPPARPPGAEVEVMFALFPGDAPGAPCGESVRLVPVGDSTFVATWWAVRPDSTAVLLAARGVARREPDALAGDWERTLVVDTLDRGAHGCARPAPAIAFEPRTGYVHVSYAMDAPEGTGVFFAHSMDAGRMFHSPVSIVYGPRLATTAIAARGDTVAVAYEDPNSSTPPQVALALSLTAGHIFEHKSIPVSAGAYAAVAPHVAFDPSGTVLARWRERRPDGEVAMLRRATWVR